MSGAEPETVKVRAKDIKPYHYGLWCSIAGGEAFVNELSCMKWSDDGNGIWFLMESFNTLLCTPDQMLDVIPIEPADYMAKKYKDWHFMDQKR